MNDNVHHNDRRYILWDTKRDGTLRYPDENTDGILGRLSVNNVYLTAYAGYPDDRRPNDLAVGERIENVRYNLSGEVGYYDLYRVV